MLRNGLEPWHLLVVVAVVVLLFGSKKLPDMARGLGKSLRILKAETAAMREGDPLPEPAAPTAGRQPDATAAPAATAPATAPAAGLGGTQPTARPDRAV